MVAIRTKKPRSTKSDLNPNSPQTLVPIDPVQRQSEPANWSPRYNRQFLGGVAVARRGDQDPLFASTAGRLQNLAATDSMRLLGDLPAIHPSVALAQWNALRLTCAEGQTKVTARKRKTDGRSKGKVTFEPDDDMTESIKQMFKSQPPEVGGLEGLRAQLMVSGLYTGMMCVEGVPGLALGGLARTFPVDPLSVWLDRIERGGDLLPFQMQIDPLKPVGGSFISTVLSGSWAFGRQLVPLNTETFFWSVIDQTPKKPYGLAPYSTALMEVIRDLALIQDLNDAVHNAAWPRLEVGVDMINLHKVAVEVYKITDPVKAATWVQARFNEVVDYVKKLQAGDNIVHHATAKPNTIQPGSFTGLEGVLNFLRQRIVQSLKTLPTLLGISDGGTQNYTSVEWQIYAAGLEALASMVDELIWKIASLHVRLMGSDSEVVIERTPVRTTDALVEANTKNVEINNAMMLEKMGYESHEEACRKLTGHTPWGPALPGALEADLSANTGREGGKPGQKQQGQGGNANNQNAPADEKGANGKKTDKGTGQG